MTAINKIIIQVNMENINLLKNSDYLHINIKYMQIFFLIIQNIIVIKEL